MRKIFKFLVCLVLLLRFQIVRIEETGSELEDVLFLFEIASVIGLASGLPTSRIKSFRIDKHETFVSSSEVGAAVLSLWICCQRVVWEVVEARVEPVTEDLQHLRVFLRELNFLLDTLCERSDKRYFKELP
jgi:hypothetical protein